jgi:3-methyladenine DNA glycosylase/8-oxoguanine DNA glycosylase
MANTVSIDVPADFNFRSTVYSHGWSDLSPFTLDVDNWRLGYVFDDPHLGALPAVISESSGKVIVEVSATGFNAAKIIRDTRHILRLDDDLGEFYSMVDGHDRLGWVNEKKAGRLLRSPTVWEDLVKTICTTNCSWALTKIMVNNLVEKLGVRAVMSEPPVSAGGKVDIQSANPIRDKPTAANWPPAHAGGSDKAFPTPAAMASLPEDFYRNEIRAGYRSPYFIELAERVASGELDPESWLISDLPTPELKKEMKRVKGVGDYAAENLLKLVGRYDGLALDSWLRSQFYKNHNNEKKCADKKIEKHYKKFGEWRGLVIWCDMTEKWMVSEPPA